jgi:hypothetical protein
VSLALGQLVILICRDDDDLNWPPFGSIGEVCETIDKYSEYEVDFPGYPLPSWPHSWTVHSSYIVPINRSDEMENSSVRKTLGKDCICVQEGFVSR